MPATSTDLLPLCLIRFSAFFADNVKIGEIELFNSYFGFPADSVLSQDVSRPTVGKRVGDLRYVCAREENKIEFICVSELLADAEQPDGHKILSSPIPEEEVENIRGWSRDFVKREGSKISRAAVGTHYIKEVASVNEGNDLLARAIPGRNFDLVNVDDFEYQINRPKIVEPSKLRLNRITSWKQESIFAQSRNKGELVSAQVVTFSIDVNTHWDAFLLAFDETQRDFLTETMFEEEKFLATNGDAS